MFDFGGNSTFTGGRKNAGRPGTLYLASSSGSTVKPQPTVHPDVHDGSGVATLGGADLRAALTPAPASLSTVSSPQEQDVLESCISNLWANAFQQQGSLETCQVVVGTTSVPSAVRGSPWNPWKDVAHSG